MNNILLYGFITSIILIIFVSRCLYFYITFKRKLNKMENLLSLQVEISDLYYDYLRIVDEKLLDKKFPLTSSFLKTIPKMYAQLNNNNDCSNSTETTIVETVYVDDDAYKKVNMEFVEFCKEINCTPKKVRKLVKREFIVIEKFIKLTDPTYYRFMSYISSVNVLTSLFSQLVCIISSTIISASNHLSTMIELSLKYQSNKDTFENRKCQYN